MNIYNHTIRIEHFGKFGFNVCIKLLQLLNAKQEVDCYDGIMITGPNVLYVCIQ